MGTGGVFLRKVRAKVDDKPTGFVWVIQNGLAGTGYPASKAQVGWLSKAGIGSLLTLTESPLPSGWLQGLDMTSKHVPMQDHGLPSLEALEEGARFIEAERSKGRAVAVHCLAGEGRTGCVLAAYLIMTERLSAQQVIARLRSVKPEFVESSQEKAVHDFAEKARLARG